MIEINGTYADAVVYTDNIDETAYSQILEICNHFAFSNSVIRVMPDCHVGTGCVIGFTAVLSEKRIIPNIVGVDIGCGVMTTVFRTANEIDFKKLDNFIRNNIPSGMTLRTTPSEYLNKNTDILGNIRNVCEIIGETDREEVFVNSLGTLGGGNHFIEIDRISNNTYMLAVHTGSRSLGLRICKYFQNHGSTVDEELKNSIVARHKTALSPEEHIAIQNEVYNLSEVSSELAYISGDMYDKYIECMLSAVQFANANRICISDEIMNYLSENENAVEEERFDTIHNYIDWYDESHNSIIIRKGAVSANTGQRLCVPLNMRDGIIVGTGKGVSEWNNSAPHGSGRSMSRSKARKTVTLEEYENCMEGVRTWSVNESTIDESPFAYKPSEEIISCLSDTIDIDFIAKTLYNFKADGVV